VSSQRRVAALSIDGAAITGLSAVDRRLVRAFLQGLNETARELDRSGLRTLATRDGDRLAIQSELATKDAHVVVQVASDATTVVYTDRHRPRSRFFRELLRPYDVEWETSRPSTAIEKNVGQYTAPSQQELEEFLKCVGSRLTYLVDWNRARKRLSRVVRNADAIALLKWAADNNIGHRAFLQAGDVRLVHAALERAAPVRMWHSGRLDDLLGRDAARLFLMAVMRIAASGRASGRSARLVANEIEAELHLYLQRSDRTLLGAAADQATVIAAAVEWISRAMRRLKSRDMRPESAAVVSVIRTWRARADEFTRRTERLVAQSPDAWRFRQLMGDSDRAVKVLERTAFTLTLVPAEIDPSLLALLDSFCGLVNYGVREYVRLLDEARDLSRAPDRSDLEQFLVTVDRLVALEDHCNAAERTMLERLIQGSADFRELYLLSAITEHLDSAFEMLVRSSLIVREHVVSLGPAS
jgi:hypothetical protein